MQQYRTDEAAFKDLMSVVETDVQNAYGAIWDQVAAETDQVRREVIIRREMARWMGSLPVTAQTPALQASADAYEARLKAKVLDRTADIISEQTMVRHCENLHRAPRNCPEYGKYAPRTKYQAWASDATESAAGEQERTAILLKLKQDAAKALGPTWVPVTHQPRAVEQHFRTHLLRELDAAASLRAGKPAACANLADAAKWLGQDLVQMAAESYLERFLLHYSPDRAMPYVVTEGDLGKAPSPAYSPAVAVRRLPTTSAGGAGVVPYPQRPAGPVPEALRQSTGAAKEDMTSSDMRGFSLEGQSVFEAYTTAGEAAQASDIRGAVEALAAGKNLDKEAAATVQGLSQAEAKKLVEKKRAAPQAESPSM